jgi:N utilization substance protein A
VVPDDQLSLAIGREGQNARLAARLTGWRVDIKSETDFATDDAEGGYGEEEELGGRCAAILTSGRRCPNAALSSSRYCGLEAHQALEAVEGDEVASVTGANGEAPDPAAVAEDSAADEPTEPETEPTPAAEVADEPVADEPVPAEVADEPVADEIEPSPDDLAAEEVAETEGTLEEAEGASPDGGAPDAEPVEAFEEQPEGEPAGTGDGQAA